MSEVDLEQTIANLTLNQQGLMKENNDLRQHIAQSQETKKGPLIYAKMLEIKKDIGSVGKDQKNAGQGWNFRGIDQFMNSLHPILNKHGVGILPEVVQHSEPKFIKNEKTGKTSKNTQLTVKYTFFAEDGSTCASVMPAEGVDPGDKGTNKALSAAFKYCLMQTFCVPTKDMEEADSSNASVDGDGTSSSAPKKTSKVSSGSSKKKSFRRVAATPSTESAVGEL
jgi:hypothetical protein